MATKIKLSETNTLPVGSHELTNIDGEWYVIVENDVSATDRKAAQTFTPEDAALLTELDRDPSKDPQPGDGGWYNVGSDRYPFTVIKRLSPKRILVQEDTSTAGEGHDRYGKQVWEYSRDLSGRTKTFTLRKTGYWKECGTSRYGSTAFFGERQRYDDPHF